MGALYSVCTQMLIDLILMTNITAQTCIALVCLCCHNIYIRQDGLKDRNLYLTLLWVKVQVHRPSQFGSRWKFLDYTKPLPVSSQGFSLCSCGGGQLSQISPSEAPNLIGSRPHTLTSFNVMNFLEAHFQIESHWGLGPQHGNLRGTGHSVYNIYQQINGHTVGHTQSTPLSRNKKELSVRALTEMSLKVIMLTKKERQKNTSCMIPVMRTSRRCH